MLWLSVAYTVSLHRHLCVPGASSAVHDDVDAQRPRKRPTQEPHQTFKLLRYDEAAVMIDMRQQKKFMMTNRYTYASLSGLFDLFTMFWVSLG